MEYIFVRCSGKSTTLVSAQEILDNIAPKFELTGKQLENYMKNLVVDGYLQYNQSDNKGQLMYVIKLEPRGEAFRRERDERIRKRWYSLGWKVLLTVVAFAVAYTLGYIFGKF